MQTGWTCILGSMGPPVVWDICTATCGDGLKFLTEQCDDHNNTLSLHGCVNCLI